MLISSATNDASVSRAAIAGKKIAIVVARFNAAVCEGLLSGAQKLLTEFGFSQESVTVLRVPGAFEIPLVAKSAALSKKYDGVIALGCVIRGETPHFEYVSLAATLGCLNAGLDALKPVSFGVITVNTPEQARTRSEDNAFNKGREAALALLETLSTLETI